MQVWLCLADAFIPCLYWNLQSSSMYFCILSDRKLFRSIHVSKYHMKYNMYSNPPYIFNAAPATMESRPSPEQQKVLHASYCART